MNTYPDHPKRHTTEIVNVNVKSLKFTIFIEIICSATKCFTLFYTLHLINLKIDGHSPNRER